MGSKIVGVLAALSVGGSVAWAANTGPANPNQQQGPGYGYGYASQVTICHQTGSQENPTVTISVNANALAAHLAHGDQLGPCR
jgi:hypothetical protein